MYDGMECMQLRKLRVGGCYQGLCDLLHLSQVHHQQWVHLPQNGRLMSDFVVVHFVMVRREIYFDIIQQLTRTAQCRIAHACIHTYIHTYTSRRKRKHKGKYIHIYTHLYIQIYIHTFIHTYSTYIYKVNQHFDISSTFLSASISMSVEKVSFRNRRNSPSAPLSVCVSHNIGIWCM